MIAGKFYLKNYDNWQIKYFMMADANDAEAIMKKLHHLCNNIKFINRAEKLLCSGSLNTGLAYSNKRKRISIIVISNVTDVWEFFNSFAHEIDHVEKHIAKTLGFSPYSEDASYLVGEIIKNMFHDIFKKIIC